MASKAGIDVALPARRQSVKERIAAVERRAKSSDQSMFLQQFNLDEGGVGTTNKPKILQQRKSSKQNLSPRRRIAKYLPDSIKVDCARVEQAEKAHAVVKRQAGKEIARINLLIDANREKLYRQQNLSPVLKRNEQEQSQLDALRAEQAHMHRDVCMQIERQLKSAKERIASLEEEDMIISGALAEMVASDGEEEEEAEEEAADEDEDEDPIIDTSK